MITARRWHTATLLPNGQVLVAGGYGSNTTVTNAELYDPASGMWTATASLNTAHYENTATLLPSGKVLIAGGIGGAGYSTDASEVYDPANGTWTTIGSLKAARSKHTGTLLPNGKVLVTGGYGSGAALASAEVYGISSTAPLLSISLSNKAVAVWWQNVSGWSLQQNGDLMDTNGWSASLGVTNANGTNYLNLTNPSGNLFFRLH
jgi:hypothetical protein